MKTKFAWAGMMALLLLAAGCQKQATTTGAAATPKKPSAVELVPDTERSKHFAAVNSHLELGGTLYGYIDVDGDALKLATGLRTLAELNPQAAPEVKRVLDTVTNALPVLERSVVTVRINLPDGILVRSASYRSLKQEVALVAFYNPVTVGLLAAMAIPAFQKTRQASQDKAILNNLRQLGAAADQYYLANGVDNVTYGKLVGPDKYVKQLQPVAGENYRTLKFKQGEPLNVRTGDGRVIRYDP